MASRACSEGATKGLRVPKSSEAHWSKWLTNLKVHVVFMLPNKTLAIILINAYLATGSFYALRGGAL